MNPWFRDPRTVAGEGKVLDAERAERRGNFAVANRLYREAAEGFASVAISVPADHPNTRSDLGIAAVVSFARAGDLGRAVEFARRMLVEPGALSDDGRDELERLLQEHNALMPAAVVATTSATHGRRPTLRAGARSVQLRGDVRDFARHPDRSAA